MPIERLRMRPWLEDIINSKKYPGVEWLDKDERIFRLPWKHASRNGWEIHSDASLFRAWAEHTGKLKSKPNPKIWKANFRCALNSLPDMEEMRDRRNPKGNDAFKVYQIVDRAIYKKKSSSKRGRNQRKKRPYSRQTSGSKAFSKRQDEVCREQPSSMSSSDFEVFEPIEIVTGFPFHVPQPFHKSHLVDHDYAITRYFDLFEGPDSIKELQSHFNDPDTTIIKTEPKSPMREDTHDYSFYEDESDNKPVYSKYNLKKKEDKQVMSDDEVVELIDELSSDCSSLHDSLDTTLHDDFPEECMSVLQKDFCKPKQRTNSAPASLEDEFDGIMIESTPAISRSNSTPDIPSILKTTAQEFLQSCL